MNPTRTLLLVPALAIALAGAGCGGSENNDFIDSYNAATGPLTDLQSSLAGAPDDAQDELDALVAAIDKNTAEVRNMADAVKAKDVQKLSAAAESFSTQGQKLVQAEENLRAAVEG
jgi:CHASE3 domain sensor protein